MVVGLQIAGPTLRSDDLAEHGLIMFQWFASPVTMPQWAIGNSFGQPVGQPTHSEMW